MNKLIATIGITAQVGLCLTNLSAQVKKMNVLFIAVDDLKPILGCYGDKLVKTPNIDRIAAKGMVFLQNHCQMALCGPTRASIMTGMRPDFTKVWDLQTKMRDVNPGILTLPQYFSKNGYSTTGVGKIFDPRCVDNNHDTPSWSQAFRKTVASYYNTSTGAPVQYFYQDPETRKKISTYQAYFSKLGITGTTLIDSIGKYIKPSVENVDVPDDAYSDGANAKIANELLLKLSKETAPFFLAVGFARPHLPFCAPKKYWDLYAREDMPVAQYQQHALNSPAKSYHNSSELRFGYTDIPPLVSFTNYQYGIGLPIEKQKELIHGYYACVSYIDAQVGKLLNTLDLLGLTENTIIVLWGDHGWHLGDHDLWCKHSNFEQATRSPLVISAPKMVAGQTKSVSEFVDVFPTVCELAGLNIPSRLDGKSLVPLMKDPTAKVKDYAVSQYSLSGNSGYTIRTEQYRSTYWMKSGFKSTTPYTASSLVIKELYDYQVDPLETVNVANDSKYAVIANEMDKKMMEFFNSQSTVTSTVLIKKEAEQTLRIIQNGQNLIVGNVKEGAPVEIFDATGRLVAVKKNNDTEVGFTSLKSGIYIIRSGSQQVKYIFK